MSDLKGIANNLVVLSGDHNGVALKEIVKAELNKLGRHCIDIGPYSPDIKVDYVDYATTLGKIVDSGDCAWGVLICGTGIGVSIAANRFQNVRASVVHDLNVAVKTREHNDSNVICLGSWVNTDEVNIEILRAWAGEPFGEGRHVKRVEKTKRQDKDKVVFTNGIFDLLHAGHINLLNFSKSLGGKLVVGINSDRATKLLKGNDRPINNEQDRKAILETLTCVDEVIIFDDVTPTELVNSLHPDILVKGAEWTSDEVRQRDNVPDDIEIKVFPLLYKGGSNAKYSTTSLVEKARVGNDSAS